jgi:hypothetical protein
VAYSDPFLRVVASGTAWGGSEIWSCSWTLTHTGFTTVEQPDPAGYAAAVVNSWWGNSGNHIASHAKLTLVKANLVGEDGHYVDPRQTHFVEYVSGIAAAGGSADLLPPQCTLAVTTVTGSKRGPAHAGRWFPPALSSSIGTDGLVPIATATDIATVSARFINALDAVDPDWKPAVVSKVGTGWGQEITGVRVGRVVDTQRRRRSSLVEGYIAKSLTDVS